MGCDRAIPNRMIRLQEPERQSQRRELQRMGWRARGILGEMVDRLNPYIILLPRSPSMVHHTPIKVLLTTTCEPLMRQLAGLLARGTQLLDRFGRAEPSPATTMAFEREISDRLREVGRRIMAWTLNRLEPTTDSAAPPRVSCAGRLYRRRRKHPPVVGTLFGPVTLWRRLYEPRGPRGRSIHPLELRLGMEAGRAPPALAERIGSWATDHTQHAGLALGQRDHGVLWSCPSLRTLLGRLREGMAPPRAGVQVEQVGRWIEQARATRGRFRPTLSVGRDGIFVPLRGRGSAGGSPRPGLRARPKGQARRDGVSGADARIRASHPHRSTHWLAPGDSQHCIAVYNGS